MRNKEAGFTKTILLLAIVLLVAIVGVEPITKKAKESYTYIKEKGSQLASDRKKDPSSYSRARFDMPKIKKLFSKRSSSVKEINRDKHHIDEKDRQELDNLIQDL